jgi:hypothetical protein
MDRKLTFILDKETPGALRYRELDERTNTPYPQLNSPGCVLGQIYIRKSELNGGQIQKFLTIVLPGWQSNVSTLKSNRR